MCRLDRKGGLDRWGGDGFLWESAQVVVVSILLLSGILPWNGQSPCLAQNGVPADTTKVSQHSLHPVDSINQHIRQAWKSQGVQPSRKCTEGEWCRRVFLDLIGRIPTVGELEAHLAFRPAAKRRQALVDQLLGYQYQQEYAENWATVWTNILIGRTGGTNRRDRTSRPGMKEYLVDSFEENKPYDRLVYQLLTATGSTTPEAEDYNGATNFLIDKLDEKAVRATTKSAEIFLGMAVGCTQCHNHPFNEAKQNQFWELSAFFRQTRVEVTRDPDNNGRILNAKLLDADFAGEGRSRLRGRREEIVLDYRNGKLVDRDAPGLQSAPLFYELRNGQVRVAYPVFVDGTSLTEKFAKNYPERDKQFGNHGDWKEVHRRRELADFIVDSQYLELALVNRMWAHFFGLGFVQPIGDMGPHHPASHPELLEVLGAAFRDADFDLKQLQGWIVLSEPYGLSSRFARSNTKDDPALGNLPQFSRFYLRQMQAEQLYESLLVATQAHRTVSDQQRDRLKGQWLRQFSTAFGTDDLGEANTFNGSIPQMLMMLNGDLVERACSIGSGSFLDQIATDPKQTNREKINLLYRTALSRKPTRHEINLGNRLLQSREGDVARALQDIWWAILNSNEFILIH